MSLLSILIIIIIIIIIIVKPSLSDEKLKHTCFVKISIWTMEIYIFLKQLL